MPRTMAERASCHRWLGWLRSIAVVSIQAMVPWRPMATKVSSRPEAGQGSPALAKPHTSKPRALDLARISPLGSSEVEVVIMGGRGEPGPAVAEDGAKGGPRL